MKSSMHDSQRTLSIERDNLLRKLILDVVTALISNGAPSHRLQTIASSLGDAFDMPADLYYLTTHGYFEFPAREKFGPPILYSIRKSSSMNFTKLPLLFRLVKNMIRTPADTNIDASSADLAAIESTVPAFSPIWIAASYIFAAMTSAIMFFHGNWKDAGMSGALAMIPAGLMLLANQYGQLWVTLCVLWLENHSKS